MNATEVSEILRRCQEVHEQRHMQYGESVTALSAVASIARRLSPNGTQFTPLDVAVCMVATKEARYRHILKSAGPNHAVLLDSLVDWINYIAIMHHIIVSESSSPSSKSRGHDGHDYKS